ncbi:MAG: hypothetical protein JSW34_03790 [Candidatus Zixiibacteriota bacterium]|nr:MAG: hypothetical protein JSW34_03790 [candidate division Zixibacteria bacterium]
MQKLIWAVVVALGIGTAAATTEGPPFKEGPQACRCNQMSEEAPHGPWMWQGGP